MRDEQYNAVRAKVNSVARSLHEKYTSLMVTARVAAVTWRTEHVQNQIVAAKKAGYNILHAPEWMDVLRKAESHAQLVGQALPELTRVR